jgi:MORN repeat variant
MDHRVMRPLLLLLAVAAAPACGRDDGKNAERVEAVAIAACPEGASVQGQAPSAGFRQRCLRGETERHGASREWYENGRERAYSEWWNGEKHGRFALWFANGKLRSEGAHRFNQPAGKWTYYGENGAILQQKTYELTPPAADWLAQAIAGKPPVRDAAGDPAGTAAGQASSEMTGAGTIASPVVDEAIPAPAAAAPAPGELR